MLAERADIQANFLKMLETNLYLSGIWMSLMMCLFTWSVKQIKY